MKRSTVAYVAVIALGLVALFGAQPLYDAVHGEGALGRRMICGPEADTAAVSLTIRTVDDGTLVADDGTEVGRVAQTQVDTSQSVSATIDFYNVKAWRDGLGSDNHYYSLTTSIGTIMINPIYNVGTDEYGVRLIAEVDGDPPVSDIAFHAVDESGGISGLSLSISEGPIYVHRETSHSPTPPRDASPAYAAEVSAEDELQAHGNTVVSVTAGGASVSHNLGYQIGTSLTVNFSTYGSWHTSGFAEADLPMTFFTISNLKMRGGAVNCSEMDIASTGDSPNLRMIGSGDGFSLTLVHEAHSFVEVGGWASAPYNVDFSEFGVWDRDGGLLPDLLCWGGFVKSALYPVTEKSGYSYGAAVPLTVSEIRGLGSWSQKVGNNSWTVNGADDKYRLWASPLHFTIDEDSAEDHGLNSDDLTIEFRVPPLSATACDAEPDVSGIATLSFNDGLGIYGPEDGGEKALAHDDWAPGANTTTPNLSGEFEVSGGTGSLALTMPNNFGSRLLAVPEEDFPAGMPGWPLQYMLHEAGIYREYDGAARPNGGTYSEPLEARYCWRGVPCINVGLSVASPTNDPIVATVKCRTWNVDVDTHVTDHTRQEDAKATPTPHEWTYVVQYIDGTNYIYLGTPEEGGGEPDLEDVYEITLTNIPVGEHTIVEPAFARDPLSSEGMTLKVFESPRDDYEHGGFSARVDHVCHYTLMDSHETNGGHSTKIEPTVRMWDHLHSPPTSEVYTDITSAFGRDDIINLLDQATEAFSCVGSDTTFDAAYKDSDDAYMTSGYAFDFCHPLDAARPLEQPVGDINFACRVDTWSITAGPEYAVWADKIVEGAIHGPLLDADGNLARSTTGEKVWRHEDGAWVLFDTPTSDAAGHWVSQSGEVYDATPALYDYGTGHAAGSVTNTGRWAAREYDFASLELPISLFYPHICYDEAGWLYVVGIVNGVVKFYWVQTRAQAPSLQERNAHPFGSTAGYEWPSVAMYPHGRLLVAATSTADADTHLATSDNMGNSWSVVSEPHLGTGLRRGVVNILLPDGLVGMIGQDSSNDIIFRRTFSPDLTPERMNLATSDTKVTICAASAGAHSYVQYAGGQLFAAVEDGSSMDLYRSQNMGITWSQIGPPNVGDGWTLGGLAWDFGTLAVVGYAAGTSDIRFERSTRLDRQAEALYIGGVTDVQVAPLTTSDTRAAVAECAGPWWVALENDGLELWRSMNIAAGFEQMI